MFDSSRTIPLVFYPSGPLGLSGGYGQSGLVSLIIPVHVGETNKNAEKIRFHTYCCKGYFFLLTMHDHDVNEARQAWTRSLSTAMGGIRGMLYLMPKKRDDATIMSNSHLLWRFYKYILKDLKMSNVVLITAVLPSPLLPSPPPISAMTRAPLQCNYSTPGGSSPPSSSCTAILKKVCASEALNRQAPRWQDCLDTCIRLTPW